MAQHNSQLPVAAQAPTSNTAAVAALAAYSGQQWQLYGISWSYSAAPTGGKITIVWDDNGTTYTETYWITAGGAGQLNFPIPKTFPDNTLVTITLTAGGSGIYGTIYPQAFTK